VQIGITPFLTFSGLGEAFNWFRHRYRNVQLNVIEGLMSRVLPRLRRHARHRRRGSRRRRGAGRRVPVQRIFQARQRIVVREGHPMQKKPTARGLAACEWVLTQPIGGGQQPRIEAMFSLAGVAPPSRVVVCEALSAMALMRATDVVGIVPEPLLGHFESSGIVPVREAVFHPCDIELLILTRSDVPLTPAAEYFVHCLSRVSQPSPAPLAPHTMRIDSSTLSPNDVDL
jgi:LysR family transcriptional regulator of abg operon